jgi:hypothetical protein
MHDRTRSEARHPVQTRRTGTALLGIYLNDHLAAATAGAERARHMVHSQPYGKRCGNSPTAMNASTRVSSTTCSNGPEGQQGVLEELRRRQIGAARQET